MNRYLWLLILIMPCFVQAAPEWVFCDVVYKNKNPYAISVKTLVKEQVCPVPSYPMIPSTSNEILLKPGETYRFTVKYTAKNDWGLIGFDISSSDGTKVIKAEISKKYCEEPYFPVEKRDKFIEKKLLPTIDDMNKTTTIYTFNRFVDLSKSD